MKIEQHLNGELVRTWEVAQHLPNLDSLMSRQLRWDYLVSQCKEQVGQGVYYVVMESIGEKELTL